MGEYIYLFRGGARSASPDQLQQQMGKWADWAKTLGIGGNLRAGDPLEKSGKVIRGTGADVVDVEFDESGDSIGGYMIVECRDLQEAVDLSGGCPIFDTGGYVEVRSILKLTA